MKVVLVLSLLYIFVQRSDSDDSRIRQCKEQWNFGTENIQDIVEHDQAPKDYKTFLQFMDCYWKNQGLLDRSGDVDYHRIRDMLADEFYDAEDPVYSFTIADTIIGNCRNIRGDSHGEKALQMARCIAKATKAALQLD